MTEILVARRGTYHSTMEMAEKLWPDAEWITGEGKWALLAFCDVLTITLHKTFLKAEKNRDYIDTFGCGHACFREGRKHVIVGLRLGIGR